MPSNESQRPSTTFNIGTIYRRLFKIWRRKRFAKFLQALSPQPSDVLLDVGGYPGFWTEYPQPVKRIDSLNLHEMPWNAESAPQHNIKILLGDGCALGALGIKDKSYEIGFSNSVIEHVGSWERQVEFASEIRRVARALWVQTPAYECPIEPHYLAPCIHYLPRSVQKAVIRWLTVRGWTERPTAEWIRTMVDETRLLRKREMQCLFPDCEIITERLFGIIPKSYIAVRRGA